MQNDFVDSILIDKDRYGAEVVDKAGNHFMVNPLNEPLFRDLITSNIPDLNII